MGKLLAISEFCSLKLLCIVLFSKMNHKSTILDNPFRWDLRDLKVYIDFGFHNQVNTESWLTLPLEKLYYSKQQNNPSIVSCINNSTITMSLFLIGKFARTDNCVLPRYTFCRLECEVKKYLHTYSDITENNVQFEPWSLMTG